MLVVKLLRQVGNNKTKGQRVLSMDRFFEKYLLYCWTVKNE